MIRANLSFNYYYPFYTLEASGKKKYYYREKVNIHLSVTRRFLLEFKYD